MGSQISAVWSSAADCGRVRRRALNDGRFVPYAGAFGLGQGDQALASGQSGEEVRDKSMKC